MTDGTIVCTMMQDTLLHYLCVGLIVGACMLACRTHAQMLAMLCVLLVVFIGMTYTFGEDGVLFRGGDPRKLSRETSTLFVSVASYRDTECKNTVESILSHARHPNRVVVGICEQNDDDDESCVVRAVKDGQIRQISIPYKEARGPCYARYLCATLHKDEDMFIQVDSHSAFVQDWDLLLVDMVNRVPYDLDRFVLTHYPIDCSDESVVAELTAQQVPVINECRILENQQLSFMSKAFNPPNVGFYTSLSVGGGFLVMHKSVLAKCPYDPNLDGVFNMEEVLQSARFFTHGIHVLSPSANLVCHKYTYETHKVPWNEATPTWDKGKNGTERCFQLLDGRLVDDTYGLGRERTMEEFWSYTGIDYANKTVAPFVTNLVPFDG